jgi:hypothetical protein
MMMILFNVSFVQENLMKKQLRDIYQPVKKGQGRQLLETKIKRVKKEDDYYKIYPFIMMHSTLKKG